MKYTLLPWVRPLFGVLLFGLAGWVLQHELKAYHYQDVIRHLRAIPPSQLFLAGGLSVASYLILTGYDVLAVRSVQHPLAYPKIALVSFIAYAFSCNMGVALLSGGSIRYRFYSSWGLSTAEIAHVIVFNSLTFWLGFFTLGAAAFLFEPPPLPVSLHFPFASVRSLGWLCLGVAGSYVGFSICSKKPLKIRAWALRLPSPRISLAQLILSSLDWAVAGSVLYALLPTAPPLSYLSFLGMYLLAQIAGLISQVPGGLGVFETVILVLLSPQIPAATILGALVAYRGLYYLLPLGIATLLFGAHEVWHSRTHSAALRLAGAHHTGGVGGGHTHRPPRLRSRLP